MFRSIFQRVPTFEAWLSLGGFLGAGTVLTWLWSQIDLVYQQGWAAVLLLGLGSACLVMAVVSLGAIAWRYYFGQSEESYSHNLESDDFESAGVVCSVNVVGSAERHLVPKGWDRAVAVFTIANIKSEAFSHIKCSISVYDGDGFIADKTILDGKLLPEDTASGSPVHILICRRKKPGMRYREMESSEWKPATNDELRFVVDIFSENLPSSITAQYKLSAISEVRDFIHVNFDYDYAESNEVPFRDIV